MGNETKQLTLADAEVGKEYVVTGLNTDDDELNSFLFTLGCYEGEKITVVAKRRSSYTLVIKDGRYNVDAELATAILI